MVAVQHKWMMQWWLLFERKWKSTCFAKWILDKNQSAFCAILFFSSQAGEFIESNFPSWALMTKRLQNNISSWNIMAHNSFALHKKKTQINGVPLRFWKVVSFYHSFTNNRLVICKKKKTTFSQLALPTGVRFLETLVENKSTNSESLFLLDQCG